jgi:hypothetical protein
MTDTLDTAAKPVVQQAEQAAVQADLAYNALKTSGELRRQEDAHALAEQLRWGD